MRAVYIKEFGGAKNLEVRQVDDLAKPKNTQVLVKVRASALNRADILQREGFYPAPEGVPERIPGLEFSGEIYEIGENVEDFQISDRVFGITAGGAQADFLLTEEFLLARIPENLSFTEAAAIPEAFVTAHDAVFTQGNLQSGEVLLIHAVGSGVGLAALQLAKAKNIKVIGTSRTKEKLDKCKEFGLDEAVLMESETDFAKIIREKNNGQGVDVILDLVGAQYLQSNLESLALKGRLILVGLVGGRKAELDMGMVLSKRAKIIGTVLRSRSDAEKAEATSAFITDVLPAFENGSVKPNIDKIFEVEDVCEAHEYLESNKSFGKVVIKF